MGPTEELCEYSMFHFTTEMLYEAGNIEVGRHFNIDMPTEMCPIIRFG
jgi:hypothetical protein